MRYVGNTALSPQIQERIQNTFQQTLSLAEEGNRQEALLGCDFILRLDPLFEPARSLQERLGEGEGPVDVAGLIDGDGAAPPAEDDVAPADEVAPAEVELPAPEKIAREVEEVAPETEDEPAATAVEPPIDILSEEGPVADTLPTQMAMLFEQRSYQDLISLALENQDRIAADEVLRQLVDSASERLEAEPYVRNFLESAQLAKEKDDYDGARAHLEKARELDSSHPDILALEADLEAASTVEPPATFEPPPLEETPPLVGPDDATAVASEVDELFASVEESSPEPIVEAPAEPEPTEPTPQAVPSLDTQPAARLDNESEQRIDELLKEGQDSFEDGQYQTAIDAWSRIFLIDIDHGEASRRIELARKLKAEVERQIEEAFHEGISLLESGDEEKAREAFDKVLEMQPNHMGARDYLDKLESGDLSAAGAEQPELAALGEAAPADEAAVLEAPAEPDLAPAPAEQPPLPDDMAPDTFEPTPTPPPPKRSFALIGAAVLILVLAIGWFVYSNWSRFFPGSTREEPTATEAQIDPIERARELHEAGNTAMAINVLRRLPPGDDQHAEAQALIDMWETGEPVEEVASEEPTEEILAQRGALLTQAQQAAARGENIFALDLLDQAAQISALDEEELGVKTQATDALTALEDERNLFDQGDWEYALPSLWRMHAANPQDHDVVRLMVDSYYNLGLRDLQRGDAKAALEKFKEAQDLTDQDESLNRLAEFASAYVQRPADMLFRIFVKYQRFR